MLLNRVGDTHYGCSMYAGRLRSWAKEAAKNLEACFTKRSSKFFGDFPVLVYSGMSGISAAVAISQFLGGEFKFGMMYVRKPYEKSHGSKVEVNGLHSAGARKIRLIFCDDFICEGNTVIRVFNRVQDRFEIKVDMGEVLTVFTSNEDSDVGLLSSTNMFERINDGVDDHFQKKVLPRLRKKAKATKKFLARVESESNNNTNEIDRAMIDAGLRFVY